MSTSKGSGRSRRKFTPEFKAEVVAMVEASGGKIAQVAREMRLHDSSVGNWVREAREAKAGNGADRGGAGRDPRAESRARSSRDRRIRGDAGQPKRGCARASDQVEAGAVPTVRRGQSLDVNENVIAPWVRTRQQELCPRCYRSPWPRRSATTGRCHPRPERAGVGLRLFVLDDDDRSLLTEIHQGPEVSHLWVELRQGAERNFWSPEPRPTRDLGPRRRCQQVVGALEGHPALDAQYSADEEAPWDPQLWVDVGSHLASDDETLSDETVQSLEDLALRLRNLEYPPTPEAEDEESEQADDGASSDEDDHEDEDDVDREAREAAASALVDLAAIERRPTPVRQVRDALSGRLPDVAFFAEADRELARDYLVADVAGDPPPALANLCALADLDLAEVQSSLEAGRVPHVEKLFEEANRNLKERFQATWSQSTVYPRLSTPSDGVLRILIATEGDADYSYPEERSDGLRWFMALHAFLAARGAREPILLVDEAETHLHYDAQADLVDALMSQRIASKVIYTTHSVGCLPPDLGCGIRVVLAEEGAERSRIVNSYWSVVPEEDDKIGYTPLLFAMGARMLALDHPPLRRHYRGPIRRRSPPVIVEGGCSNRSVAVSRGARIGGASGGPRRQCPSSRWQGPLPHRR